MDDPNRPTTPHALHQWIADHLNIRICQTSLINGHNAPFDYLTHTYFEGAEPDAQASRSAELDGGDASGLGPDARASGPARDHDARASGSAPTDPDLAASNGHIPPSVAPSLRPSVASSPDLVLWANRGGGKTFLGAVATVLDLVFKPEIDIRILAGSLEQAKRMFAHLRRFFEQPELAALLDGRITERRISLANGSNAEILAASQASVRGTRVQKLRCDEVDLFDPDIWEAAQLTTRSKQCGDVHVRGAVECLSTMHRPHGLMFQLVKDCTTGSRRLFKWGLVDVLERCGPEHACRAPDADCPLLPECDGRAKQRSEPDAGHIPIADAITMKSRVSQAAWESEMLCRRPSRGHAVLPEFDPAIHVCRTIPSEQPDAASPKWYAGIDFGFRAPTVILWAALDADDNLWIADEHARAEMLLSDHIRELTDSPQRRSIPIPIWIAADPAGHQRHEQTGVSNLETMKQAGLHVQARPFPLGEGLMALRARLKPASGPPRLRIHQRCTTLIESLERYHYPEDNPESMIPVKDGHDHAVDALRYLVTALDKPFKSSHSDYR
ncbi:MAG: hypothetical protein R3B68_11960 [Phycisphaerales bacterium]